MTAFLIGAAIAEADPQPGQQLLAAFVLGALLAVAPRFRLWRIGYHIRRRDAHDAKAWQLQRGGR